MGNDNKDAIALALTTAFITLFGLFILHWPPQGLLFFYWIETGVLFFAAVFRVILFTLLNGTGVLKRALVLVSTGTITLFFLGVMILHSLILDHFFDVYMVPIHIDGLWVGLGKLIKFYDIQYALIMLLGTHFINLIWSERYKSDNDLDRSLFVRRLLVSPMRRLVMFHVIVLSSVFLFSIVFEYSGSLLYSLIVIFKIYFEAKNARECRLRC